MQQGRGQAIDARQPPRAPPQALVVAGTPAPLSKAALRALGDLKNLIGEQDAENTRKAYRSAWRGFERFCREMGQPAMPAAPEWVAAYLTRRAEAGTKPTTIGVDLAAIRYLHALQDLHHLRDNRIITRCMNKVRAGYGRHPKQMDALGLDEWERIIDFYGGPQLIQCRNRAVICVGLWCALRRSEIGRIKIDQVTYDKEGVRIAIPVSKANKTGALEEVVMPYGICPRRALDPTIALEDWLRRSRLKDGWLFRSFTRHGNIKKAAIPGPAIRELLREAAARVGIDIETFGAHSLRASYITLAVDAGVPHKAIMNQTRHRTSSMIDRYTRMKDRYRYSPMLGIADKDKGQK